MGVEKQKAQLLLCSDEELMQESTTGNRLAFEVLYDRWFERLVWFSKSFLYDQQKAEDIVHEVFMKVIEYPEKYDPARKLSTWLFTLTANLSKNLLRDEKNRLRILDQHNSMHSEIEEPLFSLDHTEVIHRIEMALKQLNQKEQNLYHLRFEQELSIKEIAAINHIPEGSVKSGLFYMLKKMSVHLKEFIHGS